MRKAEHIQGGLFGLLVGDALGVPYEFHEPEELPPADRIEYEPPIDFRRAHSGTPPGTWSDDGAQALCLLASLLECGRLDAEDLGRRFLAWYDRGYCAVDKRVFDVGIQTGLALQALTPRHAGHTGREYRGAGPGERLVDAGSTPGPLASRY